METSRAVVTPEAQVCPQSCCLDQDVDALFDHEVLVVRGPHVFDQGMRHVGVDMVLRGAGGEVCRSFLAVDGAPREQGAVLGQFCGTLSGGR